LEPVIDMSDVNWQLKAFVSPYIDRMVPLDVQWWTVPRIASERQPMPVAHSVISASLRAMARLRGFILAVPCLRRFGRGYGGEISLIVRW
jgi:hypothetical protein